MMAVSIPPHNLDEIINAAIELIKEPESTIGDLLKHIKGPDFPSGCSIVNQEDFLGIYTKGKGSFVLRSTFEFSGNTLVIKNLPMYSIAAKIEEQIYKGKETGAFKEIIKIINTTAQSQQLTLQLKSKYDADQLVRDLCKLTDAERSMNFDLRAVDNGVPKTFTLLSYLRRWVEIHSELTKKELQLELNDVNYKLEIAEGLKKALVNIDLIIETIKQSENRSAAKLALQKMEFTENQANAILDIKLSRLTRLEGIELDKQIEDLLANHNFLNKLLNNQNEFRMYMIDKLRLFLGYDKPRQSIINNTKFPKIVKVKQEVYYLTYTQGIVKVTDTIPKTKHMLVSSKSPVYILSDNYVVPVKNDKETIYANVLGILGDDDVFHFSKDGYVKRTSPNELKVSRKAKVTSQDEIHTVLQGTEGYALITTKSGKQIQFDISTVPLSKRGAKGVIAVKLDNEQIEKIELINKPLKGVLIGRNKHAK
jgi:DNA gyrase/topoisomerase IV subunit A